MACVMGFVSIKPVGDLEQTAAIVGEALGLQFVYDKDRHYDEYPAYIAEVPHHRYALLGVPDPEDDLREEPSDDFALQVNPLNDAEGDATDISEQLLATLQKDGRLICWL